LPNLLPYSLLRLLLTQIETLHPPLQMPNLPPILHVLRIQEN